MLIRRNAEGVHGQRKVGNPWSRQCLCRTTKTFWTTSSKLAFTSV